jgi:hypothetical protein
MGLRPVSAEQVYQIRVVLRGISPLVWRRLLVGVDSTVADLHQILQLSFGWSDDHLHRVFIHGREYGVGRDGGIWFDRNGREVRLGDLKLRAPERFVYEYDFGDSWLHDVHLEAARLLEPGKAHPVCIGGRRAAPPEDCGGPEAFMESRSRYALRARCSPQNLEELETLMDDEDEWSGAARGYDPDRFDRRAVNRLLSSWRRTPHERRRP